MKFLNSNLADHNILIIGSHIDLLGSISTMTKIIDEVSKKIYLVKKVIIPENLFGIDESGYIERAAVLEKISSKFYQFLSPNSHTANVEIIVFEDKALGIASEFIEDYASIFPSKLSIINDEIVIFIGKEKITLAPSMIFSSFLSARLIDDFDAMGAGFNSGLTKDKREIKLARIDTDGLKFAHTNQQTREYYTSFALIALISKMINQKYIDSEDPGYWTSYPISMIIYDESGTHLNHAYKISNTFLRQYFHQADIKDLLFGSLEYSSIISNSHLFENFAESLFRITSITDTQLWELINSETPDEINAQDLLLTKKILHKTLIIRREQLKHIYLLEYEFASVGYQKGKPISFQERLEIAKQRVDYKAQSVKIKKAIDNLGLETSSNIFFQLFIEYSENFITTRSVYKITANSIDLSIEETINSLFREKIKTLFSQIPDHIIDLIIYYIKGIDAIINLYNDHSYNEQTLEKLDFLSIRRKIISSPNPPDEETTEDIKLLNDFIVIENQLEISIEKAKLFLSLFKEVKSSLKESFLLDLLRNDEFLILRKILLGDEISQNIEILSLIISNNEYFKQLLNTEFTIYALPDKIFYITTDNEDDDDSYYVATFIEKEKQNGFEYHETKTSLLLQVINNGNIELAELLIEFGAYLLPHEQLPEEFSYLNDLMEEKSEAEVSINLHLSQTVEEHLSDAEEDHDFIQAIVNSVIDAVTNIRIFPMFINTPSWFSVHPYYYSGGAHGSGDEDPGGGGGGTQYSSATNSSYPEHVVVQFAGINSTTLFNDF